MCSAGEKPYLSTPAPRLVPQDFSPFAWRLLPVRELELQVESSTLTPALADGVQSGLVIGVCYTDL